MNETCPIFRPIFKLMYKVITCILFAVYISAASAQSAKTGNWTMFFGQLKVQDKWSIHAEVQHRDYGVADELEQLLLRTGLNYHASPTTRLTAGYAHVTNYGDDEVIFQKPASTEHRAWEQLMMRHSFPGIGLEHRYRLEQRWISSAAGDQYLNRVRYLLRVNIPLGKKTIEDKTPYLSFYDEIFLHLTKTPFDRNRLYGGVGYQFNAKVNLQLGYLAQTTSASTRHSLQTSVFLNFDLTKK
jgi:hypothetical protein